MRLHAQEAELEAALYIFGQAGGRRDLELLDRPGDAETACVHRRDMLGAAVDEQDRQARAPQIGADGAANGTGAPDQDGVVGHSHLESIRARVSSTATFHKASMSSSDFS